MTEYVRFNPQESLYGDKNLLHSELELLNIVKNIKNFKNLRNDELVLRLTMKQKLDEALEGLKLLDKLLPADHFGIRKRAKKDLRENEKEHLTLEQEIEIIRRKLERLESR